MSATIGTSSTLTAWLEDTAHFPAHAMVTAGKCRKTVPFRVSQANDYSVGLVLGRECVYTDPDQMVTEYAAGIADAVAIDNTVMLKVIYPGSAYWCNTLLGTGPVYCSQAQFLACIRAGNFNERADASDVVTLGILQDHGLLDAMGDLSGVELGALHDIEFGAENYAAMKADGVIAAMIASLRANGVASDDAACFILIIQAIQKTLHYIWDPVFPGMTHYVYAGVNMVKDYMALGLDNLPGCPQLDASAHVNFDTSGAGMTAMVNVLANRRRDLPFLAWMTTGYDDGSDFAAKCALCRDHGVNDVVLFSGDSNQIDKAEAGLDAAAATRQSVPMLVSATFVGGAHPGLTMQFDHDSIADGNLGTSGTCGVRVAGVNYTDSTKMFVSGAVATCNMAAGTYGTPVEGCLSMAAGLVAVGSNTSEAVAAFALTPFAPITMPAASLGVDITLSTNQVFLFGNVFNAKGVKATNKPEGVSWTDDQSDDFEEDTWYDLSTLAGINIISDGLVIGAMVGATLTFNTEADGSGTSGPGTDIHVNIAPAAAPDTPTRRRNMSSRSRESQVVHTAVPASVTTPGTPSARTFVIGDAGIVATVKALAAQVRYIPVTETDRARPTKIAVGALATLGDIDSDLAATFDAYALRLESGPNRQLGILDKLASVVFGFDHTMTSDTPGEAVAAATGLSLPAQTSAATATATATDLLTAKGGAAKSVTAQPAMAEITIPESAHAIVLLPSAGNTVVTVYPVSKRLWE